MTKQLKMIPILKAGFSATQDVTQADLDKIVRQPASESAQRT